MYVLYSTSQTTPGSWICTSAPRTKLAKDKVSKEAPDTSDLALDLWTAQSGQPASSGKAEIMGEKAWCLQSQFSFGSSTFTSYEFLSVRTLCNGSPFCLEVVPDLEKFMQVIREKINTIQDMKLFLANGESDGQTKVCNPYMCIKSWRFGSCDLCHFGSVRLKSTQQLTQHYIAHE